ncbi:hypothetical protein [Streptomyces nojiriensis]|uniref:hypothetical protein n=1 Tax=Streptomyces nojiriensis TaxID=66374 RepID=UPI0035E0D17B
MKSWRPTAVSSAGTNSLEEPERPRDPFACRTLGAPWTTLQRACFAGTSMWPYLTRLFTFTLPDLDTTDLEPRQENGAQWRRLQMRWPGRLATHEQRPARQRRRRRPDPALGLRRRHHGRGLGAHYFTGYTQSAGITLPTAHRILPRAP